MEDKNNDSPIRIRSKLIMYRIFILLLLFVNIFHILLSDNHNVIMSMMIDVNDNAPTVIPTTTTITDDKTTTTTTTTTTEETETVPKVLDCYEQYANWNNDDNGSSSVYMPVVNYSIVNINFMDQYQFQMAVYDRIPGIQSDIVSNVIQDEFEWQPHTTTLLLNSMMESERETTNKEEGEQNNKSAVFVDVGANLGWFSLVMAAAGYEDIHAIEPFGSNVRLLKLSLCLNGPEFSKRVTIHQVGLDVKSKRKCEMWSQPTVNYGDTHSICEPTIVSPISQKICEQRPYTDEVIERECTKKIKLLKEGYQKVGTMVTKSIDQMVGSSMNGDRSMNNGIEVEGELDILSHNHKNYNNNKKYNKNRRRWIMKMDTIGYEATILMGMHKQFDTNPPTFIMAKLLSSSTTSTTTSTNNPDPDPDGYGYYTIKFANVLLHYYQIYYNPINNPTTNRMELETLEEIIGTSNEDYDGFLEFRLKS